MPTTRDIKRRIASVGNIQQITRAMKMVATAKLRRYEARMKALRPYANGLLEVIGRLLPQLEGDEHPLLAVRRPLRRIGFLVLTGDKGLCGGFNSGILRRATQLMEELEGRELRIVTVGRKALRHFSRRGIEIDRHYVDIYDRLDMTTAAFMSQEIIDYYLSERIDGIYFVYSEFISIIQQRIVTHRLLPFDLTRVRRRLGLGDIEKGVRPGDEGLKLYEPPLAILLEHVLRRFLATEVYRALMESVASEFGARVAAMDAATENAQEMIENLTLEYNRARQSSITAELADIVGGAEAMRQERGG